jgi:hypothetical protein
MPRSVLEDFLAHFVVVIVEKRHRSAGDRERK